MRRPERAEVLGLLTAASAAGAICLGVMAANQPPSHEGISQPEHHQTSDDALTVLAYTLGFTAAIGIASLPAPGENRQRS